MFDTDTNQRVYCSDKCYREQRTEYHKKYSVDYYREKRGTLKRWANALLESGYIVITPEEMLQ